MFRICVLLILTFSLAAEEKMSLWKDDKAPLGDGSFEIAKVNFTVFPVKSDKPSPAVIICPGGGYGGHALRGEGPNIAKWLNSHGIAGLVLQYRLPKGRCKIPLIDVHRATRLTRFNAKKWNINPQQLGIIGFSAGGHLASTAVTKFDSGKSDGDEIDKMSSRPDFGILIYPVITMGKSTHGGSKRNLLGKKPSAELAELYSSEKQIKKDTPPVFLAHAKDDKPVPPVNSEIFHKAMQAKGLKSKYLELPNGGHGLSGYKGPSWDAWQKQSLEWLISEKIITP